ncbi:MAG: M55 family metallopeptidase [Roseiflexaceae bacterium]
MKLFISADIEGVAGVVDWDQCRPEGGPAWQEGRELLTAEVNAAIEGALAAGAREIVVNDSHGQMRTLLPRMLHPAARLIQGRHKPMYMLEGADQSCDSAFFIGYHGGAGARYGVLNHTYSPYATRINGTTADETMVNALVLGAFNVPVVLVSGDEHTVATATTLLGEQVHAVTTKRGISRSAADSLHPSIACERIREAASRAMIQTVARPLRLAPPYRVEIDLATSVMADRAELIPGVERPGDRTVSYSADDVLTLYRAYQAMMFLARTAEG